MTDMLYQAFQTLDHNARTMKTQDPGDLPSLAALLKERQAAIESIHHHTTQLAGDPDGPEKLAQIREAAQVGAAMARRLKLHLADLRRKLIMLQNERLIAQALAAPPGATGTRMRCVG